MRKMGEGGGIRRKEGEGREGEREGGRKRRGKGENMKTNVNNLDLFISLLRNIFYRKHFHLWTKI